MNQFFTYSSEKIMIYRLSFLLWFSSGLVYVQSYTDITVGQARDLIVKYQHGEDDPPMPVLKPGEKPVYVPATRPGKPPPPSSAVVTAAVSKEAHPFSDSVPWYMKDIPAFSPLPTFKEDEQVQVQKQDSQEEAYVQNDQEWQPPTFPDYYTNVESTPDDMNWYYPNMLQPMPGYHPLLMQHVAAPPPQLVKFPHPRPLKRIRRPRPGVFLMF